MYHLSKRMEVAGCHRLNLSYDSSCTNLHGHNWIVTVEIEGEVLDAVGMLIDFSQIKTVVKSLDHRNLNEIFPFNPTAENIAKWIWREVQSAIFTAWGKATSVTPQVVKVTVQETEGNIAWYTP